MTAPQSLNALCDWVTNGQGAGRFREIVHEFLPEHEQEIVALDVEGRLAAFVRYFSMRYFPLEEGVVDMAEGYAPLVSEIPVQIQGVTEEDYESLGDWSPGYQLMAAFIESPFVFGESVSVRENAARLVGGELVEELLLASRQGWRPEELHELLNDTSFEGLAWWADQLWKQTDTVFLDCDYENYHNDLLWDRATVDWLTQQWVTCGAIEEKIHRVVKALEDNPRYTFERILKELQRGPKPPKRLVEVFT